MMVYGASIEKCILSFEMQQSQYLFSTANSVNLHTRDKPGGNSLMSRKKAIPCLVF